MTIFNLLLIALIQGITEFLPVSSSAHLILLPLLTNLDDQGQVIDVAAHAGTLLAVILYFWTDVKQALIGTLRLLRGKTDTPAAQLALCLFIATIPVVLFGLFLKLTGLSDAMRSISVIGWAMIIFGVLLYWADQRGPTTKTIEGWTWKDALNIGVWQAVALIPGSSRSGTTITAGRILGYTRTDAARMSMLMSIPTIIASATLIILDIISSGTAVPLRDISVVVAMSFVAALFALSLMMRLLRAVSYTPYVIYRIAFGVFLLWFAYA
jgi:undecaprenyl-diphosphatase